MTRENKLALVVGFGLILLVGILISDHFSAARNQKAATLTRTDDTLNPGRWENPDLIAVNLDQPGQQPDAPYSHTSDPGADGAINDPMSPGRIPAIEMGGSNPPRIGLNPSDVQRLDYRVHQVRQNETLSAICKQYYGDLSLLEEFARFNRISNPDSVRAGHTLRIPPADDLVRGRGSSTSPAAGANPRSSGTSARTYTVRDGDNLTEIAKRFLGSGRKYLALYEHNRDVLKSPDDLQPGMVLRIPPDSN